MTQDCQFRFVPRLPTAESYKNREFGNYHNMSAFFAALNLWESNNKRHLVGYIYFKIDYAGGTMPIYNNPKWWESGARSCIKGCCTKAPAGYIIGTVLQKTHLVVDDDAQKSWTIEFRQLSGPDGLEAQFRAIVKKTYVDAIWLSQYGEFKVTA